MEEQKAEASQGTAEEKQGLETYLPKYATIVKATVTRAVW